MKRILESVVLLHCFVVLPTSLAFVHNPFVEFRRASPPLEVEEVSSDVLAHSQWQPRAQQHSLRQTRLQMSSRSIRSDSESKRRSRRTTLKRKKSTTTSASGADLEEPSEETQQYYRKAILPLSLPTPSLPRRRRGRPSAADIAAQAKTIPTSGDSSKTQGMLLHKLLTAEEERTLGRSIANSRQLKEKMIDILQLYDLNQNNSKKQQAEEEETPRTKRNRRRTARDKEAERWTAPYSSSDKYVKRRFYEPTEVRVELQEDQSIDDITVDQVIARTIRELAKESEIQLPDGVKLFDSDIDVNERLGLEGGREEMGQILIEGATAREALMENNFRLVISIARQWCRTKAPPTANRRSQYGGSWNRPSLDEAVQEGMIGLAKAADRFDYTRQLKFSTYATYWITSMIRRCFEAAATGCLRIPTNYHGVRQRYQALVQEHYRNTGGEAMSLEDAAKELGLKTERLKHILSRTEALLSLDAPAEGPQVGMGGKAGADVGQSADLTLGSTLTSTELTPEEAVEMSLLRQCLENAMATELSPHERDILRLRHGLDDGVSRSPREVVELLGKTTISVSDVRRSEYAAFRKLRSPYSIHTYNLISFLDYIGVDPEPFRKGV